MKTLESLAQTVEDIKVEVVKDAVLDVIEKGVRKFIRTMLEIYPFGPIEDVNIPRGRKGGFVPTVIDRFKAFKKKIAKIVVEHIRTRNIIERGFKEVKRRVKVMETFPIEESCIRILYSLLRLQNEIWEGKPIASF